MYTPDANELASRVERGEYAGYVPLTGPQPPVRGTLSIWYDAKNMTLGFDPTHRSSDVHLQIKDSGLVVAYSENGDAEIFVLPPGSYTCFVPNRAGE